MEKFEPLHGLVVGPVHRLQGELGSGLSQGGAAAALQLHGLNTISVPVS